MSFRRILISLILFSALAAAQEEAYLLPLSFQGDGMLQTVLFKTSSPWKVSISSTAVAVIYLYNAQAQKVSTVLDNEVVESIGNFYLVVNTEGAWHMDILEAPSVATNTDAASSPSQTKTSTPISVDLPLKRYGYKIPRYIRPTHSDSADTKNCSDFATVFDAHDFFMASGGPELDPYDLDPDGDGYVCTYDPRETYTSPVTCDAGTEWQNPRFRVKDGLYAKGACR